MYKYIEPTELLAYDFDRLDKAIDFTKRLLSSDPESALDTLDQSRWRYLGHDEGETTTVNDLISLCEDLWQPNRMTKMNRSFRRWGFKRGLKNWTRDMSTDKDTKEQVRNLYSSGIASYTCSKAQTISDIQALSGCSIGLEDSFRTTGLPTDTYRTYLKDVTTDLENKSKDFSGALSVNPGSKFTRTAQEFAEALYRYRSTCLVGASAYYRASEYRYDGET